jgi:hypothetical protein
VEDPKASAGVPEHSTQIRKQHRTKQGRRVPPVDYGHEEWRQGNPGDEVERRRWEAKNLEDRGEECEQPSGPRRWSHDLSLQDAFLSEIPIAHQNSEKNRGFEKKPQKPSNFAQILQISRSARELTAKSVDISLSPASLGAFQSANRRCKKLTGNLQ